MKLALLGIVAVILSACQRSTVQTVAQSQETEATTMTTMATTSSEPTTELTTTAEVTEKMPRKLLLSTPHIHQEVWYYCAPTTVSMMLATQGISVDQYTLAGEMGTYEPYGTHNEDAIRILNKYLVGKEYPSYQETGYHLAEVADASPATIDVFEQRALKNFNDGYPMYYTMDVSKVYPGKSGEHNVIGIGYELNEEGNRIEWLYYYDPAQLLGDNPIGTVKKITPEHLLTAMLTCGERNYAY